MTEAKVPRPPRGTGAAGRTWWEAIAGRFELLPHETAVLRRIVVAADRIAALEARIEADGAVIETERGPVVHPAAVEVRQLDSLIGKLVAGLRIPDEDGV